MDNMLRGLNFCFVYLDDILIASRTPDEHKEHLEQVLSRMKSHGFTIKSEKCVFGRPEVNYLGYQVTSAGIKPLEHKPRHSGLPKAQKRHGAKEIPRDAEFLSFFHPEGSNNAGIASRSYCGCKEAR